jgi:hypothetical protein
MVNFLKYLNLIAEEFRIFDIFLGNFFDSPPLTSMFFLGLEDDAVGPFSQFLGVYSCTLGLKS